MKKILFIGFAIFLWNNSISQTSENKWNVGLHFGTQEYSGDLGDEFFSFNQFRAYGISFSKYLTPFWDLQGMVTANTFSPNDFPGMDKTQFLDINIMAKFKFNNGKWLSESSKFAPYLFIGFGDGITRADHYTDNTSNISVDVNMLAGLGFHFPINKNWGVDLKTKYSYLWNDNMDNSMDVNDIEDQALMTTIGVTYTFNSFK